MPSILVGAPSSRSNLTAMPRKAARLSGLARHARAPLGELNRAPRRSHRQRRGGFANAWPRRSPLADHDGTKLAVRSNRNYGVVQAGSWVGKVAANAFPRMLRRRAAPCGRGALLIRGSIRRGSLGPRPLRLHRRENAAPRPGQRMDRYPPPPNLGADASARMPSGPSI